jgi:hypothetical protein
MDLNDLMEALKKIRPTYSDTPGMGNQQPHSFPGSTLPQQTGTPTDQGMDFVQRHGPATRNALGMEQPQQPNMNQWKDLERWLMEMELKKILESQQGGQASQLGQERRQLQQGPWKQLPPNVMPPKTGRFM